ncbi:MAG: SnoaL-like domain-containing protein [Litorimonas sp.]
MFDEKLIKTAKALTQYCRDHEEAKALDTLYSQDCVSVEALDMPDGPMGREACGLEAIRKKHEWWYSTSEEHSSTVDGPFLHGDNSFSLIFDMDVTDKKSGERKQMREIGHYMINSEGKIIREAFYYPPFE